MKKKNKRKIKERPVLMQFYLPGKAVPEYVFGYFSGAAKRLQILYGEEGLKCLRILQERSHAKKNSKRFNYILFSMRVLD